MGIAQAPAVTASLFSREKRPVTSMVTTTFLSAIGNQMTSIAVPWFVLTLTGSAAQTGLTAAVTLLPSVFMSFFGGAIADRMNARALSVFADVMSGVTVALVPLLYLLDALSFPLLLLLMFLGAVFDTPGGTARSTMLPRIAERAGTPLERVNSAYGISFAISGIIGAAASGVLIGAVGATNVMWFNAAAFGISALGMRLFVPDLGINPPSGESLLADIRTGLRYAWDDTLVRSLILTALVINFLYNPVFGVAIPYYAKTVLDSATALGIIAAAFGLGSLVGSVLYGAVGDRLSRRQLMTASVALLSLPMIGMVAVPGLWATVGIMALCSVGSGLVNPMMSTMMMKRTPQHLLGRVMGVIQAGALVATPLGMILVGPALDALGLQGTFVIVAIALVAVFLSVLVNPALRTIDHLGENVAPEG